jgi:hypothetical protein
MSKGVEELGIGADKDIKITGEVLRPFKALESVSHQIFGIGKVVAHSGMERETSSSQSFEAVLDGLRRAVHSSGYGGD